MVPFKTVPQSHLLKSIPWKMFILTSITCVQKETDLKHLQYQLDHAVKVLKDSSEIAPSASPLKSLLKVNITKN